MFGIRSEVDGSLFGREVMRSVKSFVSESRCRFWNKQLKKWTRSRRTEMFRNDGNDIDRSVQKIARWDEAVQCLIFLQLKEGRRAVVLLSLERIRSFASLAECFE